ncbi:DNA polymerase III subunit alpha [Ralstonia pickettii]|uniref:DNA polymerase III subunit alpha n=1 Tax=Ralstonia pickettii TaxID=329 RepID=A0A2N4TXQ6_RALPI|nr:DNA polymerase III subunit alpha [Ralstonia pickettii]PLC44479.1 DNA polymerase III subunit alpha [Ralstonia pickettii]
MNLGHALSVRSDFSVGESLLQVGHLVDKAKELGYSSVALTDTMSLHAMVDFTNRAKKAGIKPIIGCRVRVVDDPTYRKPPKSSGVAEVPNLGYTLKLYAQDERGIKGLIKLLSKANSPEYFYYVSRVGLDDVCELEGVTVTTGDMFNLFHHPQAQDKLEMLINAMGRENVFVELVPINTPLFDTLNAKALQAADALTAATLVTYPTCYREEDDASSLDVLGAVTSNTKMDVPYRPIQFVKDFHFQAPNHLVDRIKAAHGRVVKFNGVNLPSLWLAGLKNVEEVAKKSGYEFSKQPVCLPKMAANEFMELGRKCIEGWKRRFSHPVLGYKPDPSLIPAYKDRLNYELAVLKKMGFAGYFLLVEDLVNWAKENGIIVGPGRGSVGGSLVAYLIGITDVDPIRFNLLFERFINPERLDLPDADLDFMSTRRHEVIEYLTKRYGADRVAGISNYSTLASASALRDTGRVYGLSGLELMATKLVPKEHGQSFTLTDAAKAVPELEKFRDENTEIWSHALKLEGAMRSFGQHAAGVIVAGEPLIERAVVETRGESPVVNWDKRVVEDWGLVKMDILGLSTLDVLEIAKSYIKERHGKEINYLSLPLEEPDIMAAFARGDTTGVFQFESGGMKGLLRNLAMGGDLTFEDITAATALYRPGPMDSGLMDDFIQIKQGCKLPFYEHPAMEPALKDTYGVIVYQEQVMQLAVDLAGFTRAEADHLRKAMGKKDKDKMAEMRQKWVDGCLATNGMDETKAGPLFDKIEAFAGYGFNRSHAVEYSIVSYWTMWVRVRYPAEYFAACMSIVKEEKLPGLVSDAREYGIEILPPSINQSTHRFTIPDDKHLLAPFSSVKGISENTARRIVELRNAQGGAFRDMDHFLEVTEAKGSKVNSKVRDALDKVGALVEIQPGAKPARALERRRDQTELMPGLIIDSVKADRQTDLTEKFLRAKVISLVQEYKKCDACSLAGQNHPTVRAKNTVKFMVVTDCPSWQEEKADKMLEGDSATFIKEALKAAGLAPAEGYYTSLVKAKKDDKFLSNAQINGCSGFLKREIELIKPPVIVALGSAAIKHFIPGIKGGTAELTGKAIYDKTLDATIVCGFNPQQLVFDASKQPVLEAVFAKVAECLS